MTEETTNHKVRDKVLQSHSQAGGSLLVAAISGPQAREAIADEGGAASDTHAENRKPLRVAELEVSTAMIETDLSRVESDMRVREKEILSVSEKLGIKSVSPSGEKIRITPKEPRPHNNMSSVYNVSVNMTFRIDPPEDASRLLAALVKRGYVASLSIEIISPEPGSR